MHELITPVLLGLSGLMRSICMPSLSHQTESFERLNSALGEAKGTPLSVLIACGRPNSLKARSNTVMAVPSWVDCKASTANRNRLAKSLMVKGMAIAPVGQHELALEVRTQQFVGFLGL